MEKDLMYLRIGSENKPLYCRHNNCKGELHWTGPDEPWSAGCYICDTCDSTYNKEEIEVYSQLSEMKELLHTQISAYEGLCHRLPKEDKERFLQMPSFLRATKLIHGEDLPEKNFFAKYLPAELEAIGCIVVVGRKLFLCSRDIAVGDRIWNELAGYGIVKEIIPDESFLGVKYDSQECKVEEDFKYIVKVLGPISDKAKWVKEGDEFEKNEVFKHMVCPDCLDNGDNQCPCNYQNYKPIFLDYQIMGPCGHFH
jgi:hypothetical protein